MATKKEKNKKNDLDAQIRGKYLRAKIRNEHEIPFLKQQNDHIDRQVVFELENHLRVTKEMVETFRSCRQSTGHCPDAVPPTKEDMRGCLKEINQFTHPWCYFGKHKIESWEELDNIRRQRQASALKRPKTSAPRQPDAQTLRKMFLHQTIRPKTAAVLMLRRAKEEEERIRLLKLRPMTTIPKESKPWERQNRPVTVPLKSKRDSNGVNNQESCEVNHQDHVLQELTEDARILSARFRLPKDCAPSQRMIDFFKRHELKLPPPKDQSVVTKKKKSPKKSIQAPLHLEALKEEATVMPLNLAQVPISAVVESIDRYPEEGEELKEEEAQHAENQEYCTSRAEAECPIRPDMGLSPNNQKEEEALSECQSFDSVSEVSSDADDNIDGRKPRRSKSRRKKKSKKTEAPSKSARNGTHPHTEHMVDNNEHHKTPAHPLDHSLNQGSEPSAQSIQQEDSLTKKKNITVQKTQTGADTAPAIEGVTFQPRKKVISVMKTQITLGEDLIEADSEQFSEEDKSGVISAEELVFLGEAITDNKDSSADPSKDEQPATSQPQRREMDTSSGKGTFHPTTIIIKENDKAIADMNMRSLEDPAFLASLTLEQHEALQEKLERRRVPPEERPRFYVRPHHRHRKEAMFLTRRHNLLKRQINLPDCPVIQQDEVTKPKIHVVFSKSDRLHAMEFLTRENTAQVISAKLRHDNGDLQQRVDFFIKKMEAFLKANAAKDRNSLLALVE